jgi:beta-lactamase regulating signal transducer with metallopeptidase domain
MENLHTYITDYLLTQSWHIAVLALAIAAAALVVRNKSAHVRYLLWLIVLGKCLVPPLLTVSLAVLPGKEVAEPVVTTPVEMPVATPVETVDVVPVEPVTLPTVPAVTQQWQKPSIVKMLAEITLQQWLALAWVAGVGVFVLAAAIKALRVHWWLTSERKALPDGLQVTVENSFGELGVKSVPKVWLVEGIGQPFVWGLVRGNIYLPANFAGVKNDEERRGVLGHELSHVLRFDAAVNLLQIIAQAIFWFHPFVWWVNKRIRAEREKCCDEMAIARLGARAKDYSSAIVNTLIAEHEAAVPIPSLAVAGPVKNIEDRIKTIMRPGKRFYKRPTLIAAITVLVLALVAVPTTLALTARKSKVPEKMNVELLLEKVRQAQRPAEVMEVEWEFEAGKIPEEVRITWYRSPVPYEHPEEYKAVFDGVRSRVEYHTEGYKTKEPKGPYISVLDTTVFNGKKQRVLMSREYDGKRQEQFGRERAGYNENIRTITKYVNSWPVNFNDKKELERYEFSVVDGKKRVRRDSEET